MPGDELEATIKRLSRYTLVVELVAMAACAPMFTKRFVLLVSIATILMLFDCLFMLFCQERKQKKWKIVSGIQLTIAVMNCVSVAITMIAGVESFAIVMVFITFGFLWIHNILCFIETRKDEEISFMRHVGAFIIIVTVIVCLITRKVLLDLGISF